MAPCPEGAAAWTLGFWDAALPHSSPAAFGQCPASFQAPLPCAPHFLLPGSVPPTPCHTKTSQPFPGGSAVHLTPTPTPTPSLASPSPSPPDSGHSEPTPLLEVPWPQGGEDQATICPPLLFCIILGGHADPSSCWGPVCGVSLASTWGASPPLSAARHLARTTHIQVISFPQPLPTCPLRSQEQPTSACIPGPRACPQRLRDGFSRTGKALGLRGLPTCSARGLPLTVVSLGFLVTARRRKWALSPRGGS